MDNDPTITLQLKLDTVNLLLNALGELPAKASIAAILEIRAQTAPQLNPSTPAPSDEPHHQV